jgi:thioredoxin-like negative regulator of GroEL
VKFIKLNILSSHQNKHLAAENGVMTWMIPTLIFYFEGRPVGSAVGFKPKENLKQLVNKILKDTRKG